MCVGVIMIDLCAKFYMPEASGSIVIANKSKIKYFLFGWQIQKITLTKVASFLTIYNHTSFHDTKFLLLTLPPHKFARPSFGYYWL
jgi:hypothetical protein